MLTIAKTDFNTTRSQKNYYFHLTKKKKKEKKSKKKWKKEKVGLKCKSRAEPSQVKPGYPARGD